MTSPASPLSGRLRQLLDDGALAAPGSEPYEEMIRVAIRTARAADSEAVAADVLAALRANGLEDDRLLVQEAFALVRLGRSDAALPLLDQVIGRAAPSGLRTQALRIRAKASADLGDLRGAIVDGRRALEEGDLHVGLVQSTIGRSRRIGDWGGAAELVGRYRGDVAEIEQVASELEAAGADLSSPEAIVDLVDYGRPPSTVELDELDAARLDALAAHYRADVERNDRLAGAWRRLGDVEIRRGNLESAEQCFGRYTSLMPGEAAGYVGLARVHALRSRWRDAVVAADEAVALPGRDVDARLVRAEAAVELPDPIMAATLAGDLEQLRQRVSDPAQAARLAPLLERAGRPAEAAAFARMAGYPATARAVHGDRRPPSGQVVLYTVLTGGYDDMVDPTDVLGDVQYVVLTDDVGDLPQSLRPYGRPFDVALGDAQLASRHPKMLPHEYFPDADISVYVDANFHLLRDPTGLAEGVSSEHPMTVLTHVDRSTPAEETVAVVERGFADWGSARTHLAAQAAAGFDPFRSPLSYGGFLVRHHGSEPVRRAMETWWDHFRDGIRRDQTSLDFALWSHDVEVRRLPLHNHRNEYWMRLAHA